MQAIFICPFLGLMAMALREDWFDHAVRIGWPKIFFTAFDAKNETLNYSGDFGNLLVDLWLSFLLAIPLTYLLRTVLRKDK